MKNNYLQIEGMRKIAGTLPSELPTRKTEFPSFVESLDVTLEDYNANPYKAMFVTATATWGDNEYRHKWKDTPLEGKLEVIKAVLTGNTLPQARELINFIFRIKGVPRWLFDIHTQVPFTTFMSIGCRDNNKIDCDIVLTSSVPDDTSRHEVFEGLKDLYEYVLDKGEGSWQSARSFLPQSYSHSYFIGQNLLSFVNTKISKENEAEEKFMRLLYVRRLDEFQKKIPSYWFACRKFIS